MKLSRVVLTTIVATLTAVAVIAALFGSWRVYNHVSESDPLLQAGKVSMAIQEKSRGEMEVLQEQLRRLNLNTFERKHGLNARLELEDYEMRQLESKRYVPECEEKLALNESINETQEARTARFNREARCRMAQLEREYHQMLNDAGRTAQ